MDIYLCFIVIELAVVICFVMIAGMACSIAYMEKRIDDKYNDYDKED